MQEPRRRKSWADFHNEDTNNIYNPPLPLDTGQTLQSDQQHNFIGDELDLDTPPSSILPSSEAHFFDIVQAHRVRTDLFATIPSEYPRSGINYPHPYPNERTVQQNPYLAFTSGYLASYLDDGSFDQMFTEEWWDESGILKTYPPIAISGFERNNPAMNSYNSGIFHWNSEVRKGFENSDPPVLKGSLFSNGEIAKSQQIDDFTIFNNYFHQEFIDNEPVEIPYISTYKVSIDLNPYKF
jgi:hypothetical protein